MLELKNICKSYTTGDFTQKALDNVSVSFRDSEFVAVLGPSGSGKTTMLNVIGGLDHYDSGDLIINGTSTKKFKDKDWDHYRNNQVGFVFQNYNLIPHQSVLSNVELALTLSGMNPSARKQKAREALNEVGLADHIHKKPNQLSGGQQQRVAIARAIVNDPNIVFADEPTGALDTKTSTQIMEILKKISKNKLVVMVTHNPEIANEYATRIVNLKDAQIVGDSNPIDTENVSKSFKTKMLEKGKTAMSFATALSLSFANLMGKKGRTFMTAFAGSIGIIGISAILALSTGTNQYIKNVEANTLSQYPLSVTRSKSLVNDFIDTAKKSSDTDIEQIDGNQHSSESNSIAVRAYLSKVLTTSGKNNLVDFKKFLDSNPSNLNEYANSIEYKYNTTPLIYTTDIYGTRKVMPNETMTSLTGGSNSQTYSSMMGGTTGAMSSLTSSDDFFQMPKNANLFVNSYSVVAGKWPSNVNECVLVLFRDQTMNDSLLYTLGLADNQKIKDAIQNFTINEKVDLPTNYNNVAFDEIINKTFKVVNPGDLYEYNSKLNIYVDKSEDKDYLSNIIENYSQDLKIVGIVCPPKDDSTALPLSTGINYLPELSDKCIQNAAKSAVVKAQLANPEIDVLTGKTFSEEKNDNEDSMSSLSELFEIDMSAFQKAFKFDMPNINPTFDISPSQLADIMKNSIEPQDLSKAIEKALASEDFSKESKEIIQKAINDYIAYVKDHPEVTPQEYFSKDGPGYQSILGLINLTSITVSESLIDAMANASAKISGNFIALFKGAISQSMNNIVGNLSAMGQNFSVDANALKDAFKLNLTKDKIETLAKLMSGSQTRSYETNLSTFGYSDVNNPNQITIYPNDFNSKDEIAAIIDEYNDEQTSSGHPDNVISYTDYAKLLMTSITTMIDMITAVLIAFVAISLVVSSIMIGIITYISVLERRREIGILRAIGARKRDIFNVFNAETFIVGLLAGIIGIAFTAIACFPTNIVAQVIFNTKYDIAVLPIWAGLLLILISISLTFIAGLIPSTTASKKDPVEAINS